MRASPYRTTIARQTRKTTITTTLRSGPDWGTITAPEEVEIGLKVGTKQSIRVLIARNSAAPDNLNDCFVSKGESAFRNLRRNSARRNTAPVVETWEIRASVGNTYRTDSEINDERATMRTIRASRQYANSAYKKVAPIAEILHAYPYSFLIFSGISILLDTNYNSVYVDAEPIASLNLKQHVNHLPSENRCRRRSPRRS